MQRKHPLRLLSTFIPKYGNLLPVISHRTVPRSTQLFMPAYIMPTGMEYKPSVRRAPKVSIKEDTNDP